MTMPKHDPEDVDFEIKGVVSAAEVPNWARKSPKWKKLIDRILDLKPNTSLTVSFPDRNAAIRARNSVRDTINLRQNSAVIRTRVVPEEDGSQIVYFTRLADSDVREEVRIEPTFPEEEEENNG